MTDFELYFTLGREHIMDIMGMDHILFVIALCAIYQPTQWKKVLVLVTAFTIGHSLTLALVVLGWVSVSPSLIEMLIPVTILITAVTNIWTRSKDQSAQKVPLNYFFAIFFGLIHGMGFSNYLQALLGSDSEIVMQLFAFNLGLEVGQIVIVLAFMLLAFVVQGILGVSRKDWILAVSSAIGGIAITLMIN
ncbi:MAG: HupE/UreJ family protein [Reichenbachiella sp.]